MRLSLKQITLVLGAALALSACTQSDQSHSISALETESSSRAVPEAVSSVEILTEDSVRFMGDLEDSSYFVARSAEDPEFEACLIEVHPDREVPTVACSGLRNMEDHKITAIDNVTLVADNPPSGTLENQRMQKVTSNLWIDTPTDD